jgi:integrase
MCEISWIGEAETREAIRLYDLRHTYASLMLSARVPLLYVAQQLGHRNSVTTLRYYAQWLPSEDVEEVQDP